MNKITAQFYLKFIFQKSKFYKLLLISFFIAIFFPLFSNKLYAVDVPTPTVGAQPGESYWLFDSEVTDVGKSAERARQFIWWVFSSPPIHYHPVFIELWGISRNIMYVFVLLVIVSIGMGIILSRRGSIFGVALSGITGGPLSASGYFSIFIKIVKILFYITFSYIIVLGLIQIAEVIMRFFIEQVGGKELFNIVFANANTEDNYLNFVGYRNFDPIVAESANVALTVIRLTTLTYYVMGIIVVLRTIILWFLLVLSPFLALLMPFVFIRNTGWIWIGVFFQWLFYGPLLSIFLGALTKIWSAGIPFPFRFGRSLSGEVVYPTAINILYGGPAQSLSLTNSSSYVDTFAEYLISLIMLWAVMILPWLLLRIFRDYCCELIAAGNASLNSILDRMRQIPPSPQPLTPLSGSDASIGMKLPFRTTVDRDISQTQTSRMEQIRDISHANTSEIARSLNVAVGSLADISRMELNKTQQSFVSERLQNIKTPSNLSDDSSRQQFQQIRAELQRRAYSGDRKAQEILMASEKDLQTLIRQVKLLGYARDSLSERIGAKTEVVVKPQVNVSVISKETGLPEAKVNELITAINQLKAVLSSTVNTVTTVRENVEKLSQQTSLSEERVRKILENIVETDVLSDKSYQLIAEKNSITEEKVRELIILASSQAVESDQALSQVSKQTELDEQKVKEILKDIIEGKLQKNTAKDVVAKKAQVTAEQVDEVRQLSKAKAKESSVSFEDYEEVKSMWLKHYNDAPVPTSEDIKSREDWIRNEKRKLTNVYNQLLSENAEVREKGLEQVSEILPYMLLGGFSEAEITAYVKAKLEACKQIGQQLSIEEKAKKEVEKKKSEEDDSMLVEVKQKKSDQKSKEAHMNLDIKPEDIEKDKNNPV
jgi:hypothetical protein